MDKLLTFKHLIEALEGYTNNVRLVLKGKISDEDKIASGHLLNSINTRLEYNDQAFEVLLDIAGYWKYIESGRKKYGKHKNGEWPKGAFPPVNAILEWIKVKPILPRPMKNGKLPTDKQLAYLISRKIAVEGIEPKPILAETLEEVNERYEKIFNDAILLDLSEAGDKILMLVK